MNTLKIASILIGLGTSVPALAEIPSSQALRPGIGFVFESGWLSNIDGRAGGRGGAYVETRHSLSVGGQSRSGAVHAGLSIHRTLFPGHAHPGERAVAIEIEGETSAGPATVLAGSVSALLGEEGGTLPAGPDPIATETPRLELSASGEAVHGPGEGLAVLAGVNARARLLGETRFPNSALAPEKLGPDIGLAAANLVLRGSFGPMTASGGLAAQRVLVDPREADRFGRDAATQARVFAGLGAEYPGAKIGVDIGADLTRFDTPGIAPVLTPFLQARVEMAAFDAMRVWVGLDSKIDIEDPADGAADYIVGADAGLGLELAPGLALSASIFAEHLRSAAFDVAIADRRGAEVELALDLGESAGLSARIAHTRFGGLAPGYDETRIGLMLRASL